MTLWLAASDGSYDHRLGLGAWGVAVCRGLRRDGSLHGLQSRSGSVPAPALSPHACEAQAVLRTLLWIRKLRGRDVLLATDCVGIESLIRGESRPDVHPGLADELADAARGLRWTLVSLDGKGDLAAAFRDLHHRCHRAAVSALRKQRTRAEA